MLINEERMRFTEKDLELKKQEIDRDYLRPQVEKMKHMDVVGIKTSFGNFFSVEEMIDMTINQIVELRYPLTEERRQLVQNYMEYEFGDNDVMGFVDEYDQENRIYVDMENQVCNDEDLMCYVQERLIEENE
jgi:lysyl-tRNA synthetase class I